MPSKARTTSNSIEAGTTTTSAGTTNGTVVAPFFTLAIEGPNTAVALDASGVEIVSLHFEDFNDLTSDSFLEFATAAVVAVTSSSRRSIDREAENEAVISLLVSESDRDDVDMDEIFAAVLAENEAARVVEHLDADLALALRLQEEELEKTKRLAAGINSNKGAWGTHPSFLLSSSYSAAAAAAPQPQPTPTSKAIKETQSSFSNTMGTAPGIPTISNINATSTRASDVEFPLLPPPTKQQPPPQQQPLQKRVPLKTTMASERSTGIRKLHTSSTTNTNSTSINNNKEHLTALDDFDYLNHHSNYHHHNLEQQQQHVFSVNGGDLSTIQFLDSYDKEAIESRATALRFAQAAASKGNNNTSTAATTAAASRQAIKKMMDTTSSSSRRMNTSQEENNEEEDVGYNGRKKIRTLVMSMIASGWEFLPDRRGSGHYMYQRFIPPTGHKQILVLPCTPSSQRSIDAVQARLQRMDREAAEVRAKAKTMTATT